MPSKKTTTAPDQLEDITGRKTEEIYILAWVKIRRRSGGACGCVQSVGRCRLM